MEHTIKETRQNEVIGVMIMFFVLSWVTVSLRFYVRCKLTHTWGLDDSFMVPTLVFFTAYLALITVAALYGIGRHRWDLEKSNVRTALLFYYLSELMYILANSTLKFSIGFFYLRFAMQRWHIWTIKSLMSVTILFSFASIFLVLFQCIPVSEFWNKHPSSEKCMQAAPMKGIVYTFSAANAAADWVLGTLPIFILWDLQMKLKTKILAIGILAFAAIGSTATIVRMFYLHTLMQGPDFLYANTDLAIWSTVEPGIGIFASSIATLRPLVRHYLGRVDVATRGSQIYYPPGSLKRRKDRRGYRRSLSPSELVPTHCDGTTSMEIHEPKRTIVPINNYEEIITLPPIAVKEEDSVQTSDGYILHTTTMQQDFEPVP